MEIIERLYGEITTEATQLNHVEALPHQTELVNGTHQLDTLNTNGHIQQPGTPVLHEVKSVPEALFRRRHVQFLVICIVLQPSSLMTRSFHGYGSLLRNG